MPAPVYLDYNASTPLAPAVTARLCEALESAFGNPSSPHWAGRPARALLDAARAEVAALLGCAAAEIVFTSGGSESSNTVIQGTWFVHRDRPLHVVTSVVEHPATAAPCAFVERLGARVTRLPVDGHGRVDPDDLRRAITSDTRLVSLMHANNETGTLQPIAECAAVARAHGIPFHTDAAQSCGKVAVDVAALDVDYLTLAGHKMYAPKGIGALYVRDGAPFEPLVRGAGHEHGRRAGTEPVALVAALGAAAALVADLQPMAAVAALRDRLWTALSEHLGERVVLHGHPTLRLPNTLNVGFVGHVGGDLLAALPWLAASTGSACHAGRVEPSPVLSAMGVPPAHAAGALRLSLGRETTVDEIDAVADALARLAR